jgi:Excinuclease ATPase subunit
MLSRYRGRTKCSDCKGKRLRKEAEYVKINDTSIFDLVDSSIEKNLDFFTQLKLNSNEIKKSKPPKREI